MSKLWEAWGRGVGEAEGERVPWFVVVVLGIGWGRRMVYLSIVVCVSLRAVGAKFEGCGGRVGTIGLVALGGRSS